MEKLSPTSPLADGKGIQEREVTGHELPATTRGEAGFQARDAIEPTMEAQIEKVEAEATEMISNAQEDGASEDDKDDDKVEGNVVSLGPKKKKKKKKPTRAKAQRGLTAPTGFEEFHADAPLTPDQHAEEQILYDPVIPFTERILTAVQRFERRRKLSSERRDIFYKYLAYGGIDIGPNMFQGRHSKQELEDKDADQITSILAQTSIASDKDNVGKDSSKWVVDFEGIMKGFLSRRAPYYYGFEAISQVHTVTSMLENFMNYLLHHDVCPEYAADILAARRTCKIASTELWASAEAQRWLPGDFNVACSTLFGGSYARNYDGETSWRPDGKGFVGMTEEIAEAVVKFGIAGAADEEVYEQWYELAMAKQVKVVEVLESTGFEITEIVPVDEETRQFYKAQSSDLRPVGVVRAKPWAIPDAPPPDLTPQERAAAAAKGSNQRGTTHKLDTETSRYTFFIEQVVQQHLFVGMKLEATIHRLNCGDICFFDDVLRTHASFDTYLTNEMLVGWKEPRAMNGAIWAVNPDGEVVPAAAAEQEGVSGDGADGGKHAAAAGRVGLEGEGNEEEPFDDE